MLCGAVAVLLALWPASDDSIIDETESLSGGNRPFHTFPVWSVKTAASRFERWYFLAIAQNAVLGLVRLRIVPSGLALLSSTESRPRSEATNCGAYTAGKATPLANQPLWQRSEKSKITPS